MKHLPTWKQLTASLLLVMAAGCGRPAFLGAAHGEFPLIERTVRPEAVKDFAALFDTNCRGCHGTIGRLGPAPPLNDPLFLAIVPDTELRRVISSGRENTLMPAFAKENGGALTAEQVTILVEGMRKQWEVGERLPNTPSYLASGKPGNAKKGATVFANQCANCHGAQGRGKDAGALNDPAFLALISDQALRRIVITGRSDLGMPGHRRPEGIMTAQDVTDVVAFLNEWRRP